MIRRDVSTSSLTNFAANSNDVNNRTMQKAKKATISEKIITIAAVRDQTSDKLRAMKRKSFTLSLAISLCEHQSLNC